MINKTGRSSAIMIITQYVNNVIININKFLISVHIVDNLKKIYLEKK